MMALSESPTDLTTPLRPPRILSWFDSLSAGRCTLPQLSRWVLEACRVDPSAADGVLLLLDEYRDAGKLKQFDFRPLQRELQRRARQVHDPVSDTGPIEETDARPSDPPKRRAIRDKDPTQTFPMPAPATEAPVVDPLVSDVPVAEHSVKEAVNEAPAPSSAAPVAPVGTQTILRDRYILHDEIGRGGAGTVYLAFDRNRAGLPHDQQYVALKVVRAEHARRPETLHALRREFHQAQSLSHPGIVNVFDFDHDGDTHFVTMELLDGEPLGELMSAALPQPLARETAYRILGELGDAIAYAHERDVLHLDLKPGNVMVLRQGHVRVLDFGLAQTFMAEPWISDMPIPPAATPAYASCERLVGDLPDVRDDIFSFACLAYELLSGRHPFGRASAVEARGKGLKPRRIRGLSHRQWRMLKRALAFSREDRPGSMQELLDGLALTSGAARRSARAGVRPRRGPVATWPIAAMSVAVLGIIAALTWSRLPDDLRASVAARTAATGSTLRQASETARTWVGAHSATSRVEPNQAAPSVTSPASTAAPPLELAAPPVASPVPGPDAVAVQPPADEATATPPSTDPGAAVSEPTIAEPADTTQQPAASPSGDGPGTLEFAADTVTVSESDSMARVKVRRRGGATGAISFAWRTLDDSALAGEDYAAAELRETMAEGQTSATLLIPLVADSVAENTELLDLVIEDPSGARLGSVTRVPVIIIDDD
jgi:serine/threonine protein kinase